MTLAQAQTELAQVNTAIGNILTGGVMSYGINGRQVTKLPLDTLYKRQSQLNLVIARMTNGAFTVAKFRDPE